MAANSGRIVGGGLKKVLYTLQLAQKTGIAKTSKALTAKNACKACGLGMGGQAGGMTNELGEFPAVCNKSVQAQSSDLQPEIPEAIFNHTLADLKELDERECNLLGRLNTPLKKSAGGDRYEPCSWEQALAGIASRLQATVPDRSFFYSSGRSSNEAGFLLQLFARVFGTNNVNNCSFYCHQATSVALQSSVGTGTATVELSDLSGCDLVFLVGANPASNHPRLIHQLKAVRERGGEVIVINPAKEPGLVRFAVPKSPASLLAGGHEIASLYLQPKIGSDIALFKGIAKALLAGNGVDTDFIADSTMGFDAYRQDIANTTWGDIVGDTGLEQTEIERVANKYRESNAAVFAWGMGLTHHVHGVGNIEQLANLSLLRGMVGRRYAGLLPLRGHSNVQGIGTIGVKPVLANDVFSALEARLGVSLPETPGKDTMACMQAANESEIDFALFMGGNLFAANPQSHWSAEALDKIGCKVYLTTTLNRGHFHGVDSGEVFILPVTARDEEFQATTQESMFNYVRLSDGGIVRLNQVRSESQILCELAERVISPERLDFSAFRSHQSIREAIADTVPGMEALQDIGVAKKEFYVRQRIMHTPTFATESGKAHFRVTPLPQKQTDLPFVLATVRSEGQFNSIVYENEDSYRGVKHRWSVLMNADDLASLGISPGDRISVRSEYGAMENVEACVFDLPKGNMLAYYPEANALTGTHVDSRSKTPAFKSINVAVIARARKFQPPQRAKSH